MDVDIVAAGPFLEVGRRQREAVVQRQVAETANEVELLVACAAGADTARLDAIEFDVVQIRAVIDPEDVGQEEVVRRQAEVAWNRQVAIALDGGVGWSLPWVPMTALRSRVRTTTVRVGSSSIAKPGGATVSRTV